MNFVTTTTGNVEIDITTRAAMAQGDTLSVSVDISKESDTSSINYSGIITMGSYYSSLSIAPNDSTIEFNDETFYNMTVKDLSGNIIYKGRLLSTTQDKTDYIINNDNFTTTTSSGNDFLIFE